MKKINTTVYRLPGAGFAEKDGTFVNSARWLQWKNVALPPPGRRGSIRKSWRNFPEGARAYQKEGGKFPDPILQRIVGLHRRPIIRPCRRSPRRLTVRRSPTSRIRKTEYHDQGGPAVAGFCVAA